MELHVGLEAGSVGVLLVTDWAEVAAFVAVLVLLPGQQAGEAHPNNCRLLVCVLISFTDIFNEFQSFILFFKVNIISF